MPTPQQTNGSFWTFLIFLIRLLFQSLDKQLSNDMKYLLIMRLCAIHVMRLQPKHTLDFFQALISSLFQAQIPGLTLDSWDYDEDLFVWT